MIERKYRPHTDRCPACNRGDRANRRGNHGGLTCPHVQYAALESGVPLASCVVYGSLAEATAAARRSRSSYLLAGTGPIPYYLVPGRMNG